MIDFYSCVSFCTAASNDQTINTHHQNNIHNDYETNTLTKHLSITQPTNKTFLNAHDDKNAKESTNQFRQSFPSHENMLLETNVLNEDNVDHNLIATKELKTKRQVGKEN